MLFRDNNGKLIEINQNHFFKDSEYYSKICKIKGITFPKSQLEKDRIIDLIQKKN
tara:strand:- start:2723 stop:2887 length:165 start_codon:yes stop_codon:yes gene_type:complete